MTRIHTASYKPLLFTTTMRNPERIKPFLAVLKSYDGQVLTNDLIKDVFINLIKQGLYQPTRAVTTAIKDKWRSETELSDAEAKLLFDSNPQEHKEAGFDRGWPSRFSTSYRFPKELGFVNFAMNEPITFSVTGNLLLEDPANEQTAYANAFARYQSRNPFRRVLNENVPLVLLLQTLTLLKEYDPDSAGMSRRELPLLICWTNNDAEALFNKILEIRKKYGYDPSGEVIVAECKKLINSTVREDKSLLVDYPDEFIRKMKLTGLITIRGLGRFIDMNSNEQEAIRYILANYSNYQKYDSEDEYYVYMSTLDIKLKTMLTKEEHVIKSTHTDLQKWATHYTWTQIKDELLKLATKRSSTDEILKFLDAPLRLEFLTSLALVSQINDIEVIPNYIVDDEGLPSSHAPGNGADIECHEPSGNALVEVTLLTGTAQHQRESFSIMRHLQEYIKQGNQDAYTLFVSPKTFADTCEHAAYVKHRDNIDIKCLNVDNFVLALENNNTLHEVAFG